MALLVLLLASRAHPTRSGLTTSIQISHSSVTRSDNPQIVQSNSNSISAPTLCSLGLSAKVRQDAKSPFRVHEASSHCELNLSRRTSDDAAFEEIDPLGVGAPRSLLRTFGTAEVAGAGEVSGDGETQVGAWDQDCWITGRGVREGLKRRIRIESIGKRYGGFGRVGVAAGE